MSYFDFKQFRIYHDKCAMKVGTDAVLLGAWCPIMNARRILDIGTGNGFVLKQIQENSDIRSTLTGVDNSSEMVITARENLGENATILEGDNNNLPFADNFFDIVTAKNVTRYNSDELYVPTVTILSVILPAFLILRSPSNSFSEWRS